MLRKAEQELVQKYRALTPECKNCVNLLIDTALAVHAKPENQQAAEVINFMELLASKKLKKLQK